MRVQGQVRGSRQLRPNESFNSFRKSSVIGSGSALLQRSHSNHAAAMSSSSRTAH